MYIAINFNHLEQHIQILNDEIKHLTILKNELQEYLNWQTQNACAVPAGLQSDLVTIEKIISSIRFRKEFLTNLGHDFRMVDEEILRELEKMRIALQGLSD